MENKPRVSIIVPVFNREKTIAICIESILKSEFKNFEILLVDDGSTDSTKQICLQFATKDKRVKFYSKANEGVSVARNVGLSKAKADWITFVDSDDAILSCHLNVMDREYSNDVDLVMTSKTRGRVVDGNVLTNGPLGAMTDVVYSANAAFYLFNDFNPFKNPVYPVWNKFFRRSILVDKNIAFNTTMSLGEDQVFLCEYLKYAKGLFFYKIKSYINVYWPKLTHLGSKLRTPEDYLYNHKKNYEALCSIIQVGGAKRNCMRYIMVLDAR